MNKYQNGKIYKLVSKDASHDLIYIGSTCQPLRNRLGGHKSDFNKGIRYLTSFQLFEKGEVDIIEIEKFPCNDKQELHARERHYIESLDCVNKIIPTRTQNEYYKDNKENINIKRREYNKNNKNKINELRKEYYKNNTKKFSSYGKKYRENHIDELKHYFKEYRKNNMEHIQNVKHEYYIKNKESITLKSKENIICSCGKFIRKYGLKKHQKTKTHLDLIEKKPL